VACDGKSGVGPGLIRVLRLPLPILIPTNCSTSINHPIVDVKCELRDAATRSTALFLWLSSVRMVEEPVQDDVPWRASTVAALNHRVPLAYTVFVS
jgi:hypothetical protein